MSDPRHALGLAAEAATEAWLARAEWRVMARRCRPPGGGGELDLVAVDPDGVLVAIEVRARRTSRAGRAASTVGPARIRRLRRSLARIGAASGHRHAGLRVDLVTAEPLDGEPRRWRLARIRGIG
jgi:putative endonuclease